jgi:hypothetical protein
MFMALDAAEVLRGGFKGSRGPPQGHVGQASCLSASRQQPTIESRQAGSLSHVQIVSPRNCRKGGTGILPVI